MLSGAIAVQAEIQFTTSRRQGSGLRRNDEKA
jgi:hypothetical protein